MAKTAAQSLPQDRMLTEQSWHRGLVTDSDPPSGGLHDVKDWLVEQPGKIYKRGGWERHSASNGACAGMKWVGTIHAPTRVVAIGDDLNLYDVTSENSPDSTTIGSVGFFPKEKSPRTKEQLVLCDPDALVAPKIVRFDVGDDAIVIENFTNNPPPASHSTIYAGGIVLGRGPIDFSDDLPYGNLLNRIWFEPTPDDVRASRPDWDTTLSWIDTSYEITGLASFGGALLIFSTQHVERITGVDPPGVDHSNGGSGDMLLQPYLGVGCLDARSISYYDEGVIFAGEEGVWLANGSAVSSLTEKADGTGIQSFWRSLFPRHHEPGEHNFRQLIGGVLNRDFYLISILDEDDDFVECLLCHIPSRAWTRVTNIEALSMDGGRDEQEIGELYFAEANAPYVSRAVPILYPAARNTEDGNSLGPSPTFTTGDIARGTYGLKSYGFGFVSYKSDAAMDVTLRTALDRSGNSQTTTLAATTLNRKRMDLFKDSQAAWWEVEIDDPGEQTEIYYLEAETREYPPGSDSLGA